MFSDTVTAANTPSRRLEETDPAACLASRPASSFNVRRRTASRTCFTDLLSRAIEKTPRSRCSFRDALQRHRFQLVTETELFDELPGTSRGRCVQVSSRRRRR